jgi:hypothetical protein
MVTTAVDRWDASPRIPFVDEASLQMRQAATQATSHSQISYTVQQMRKGRATVTVDRLNPTAAEQMRGNQRLTQGTQEQAQPLPVRLTLPTI